LPRKHAHDNDPPFDLRRRSAPVGRREKLHERMERELTNLMHDRRYWDGDRDYRAYVRRQFERVYNDPTGKPGLLRIGAPKIFATEIEPYDAGRQLSANSSIKDGESTAAREQVFKIGSSTNRKEAKKSDPFASRSGQLRDGLRSGQVSVQVNDQLHVRRAAGKPLTETDEPGWLDKLWDLHEVEQAGSSDNIDGVRARAEALLGKFEEYKWNTAKTLLQHYLEGSGDPLTIPSDLMRTYPPLIGTYKTILTYFSQWLMGMRSDTIKGVPELPSRDGEVLIIGLPYGASDADLNLDDFVMWERSFSGVGDAGRPGDLWALGTEAHYAIGGGTLKGYAVSLTLTREGDRIRVAGQVYFRVGDMYNFADDDSLGLHLLEQNGGAKSFSVVTEPWALEVNGYIAFKEDEPKSAALWFADHPLMRGTAGDQPRNPRMRQYTP